MRHAAKGFLACALMLGALGAAPAAYAAITVMGSDLGYKCYLEAQTLSVLEAISTQPNGKHKAPSAVDICTQALADTNLTARDMAATYNNRGLLLFAQGSYIEALRDFEQGLHSLTDLGELHVNRGSALLALHRREESIDELSKGIALNSAEIEKAYYDRAIAYEELGDVKHAYFDYLKASELKPEWDRPRDQLTRFTVHHKDAQD